jgi:hypothetical protein
LIGPIYVTPPLLNFGSCGVRQQGQTEAAFLLNPWWNNGTAIISSITIQGGSDFTLNSRGTTCGSKLPVGAICTIAIQFNPNAGGQRQAKLVIQDNAWDSPQVVILEGSGEDYHLVK